MDHKALKRKARPQAETFEKTIPAAETFAAGGTVGKLHERLRNELGLDWDDPLISDSAR